MFQFKDFAVDTEGERVIVADRGGDIVGFASVWTEGSFLHNLFVERNAQGVGIGRQLLHACLEMGLKKPARLKCVVKNRTACEFYERMGWRNESTSDEGPLGPYHVYIYE